MFIELSNAKYDERKHISLEIVSFKIQTKYDENISLLHRESRKFLSLFQIPA